MGTTSSAKASIQEIRQVFFASNCTPKVNVIDVWRIRMWHGRSNLCGENCGEKVRPFENIPEDHLLAISKYMRRYWRMWKRVIDHFCYRLDDLKTKGVYDWKGSDRK